MAGKKPDYKVCVSREGQDQEGNDKTFYNDIGAAWRVGNGAVSVQLHALPIDGKCVLFVRDKDEK